MLERESDERERRIKQGSINILFAFSLSFSCLFVSHFVSSFAFHSAGKKRAVGKRRGRGANMCITYTPHVDSPAFTVTAQITQPSASAGNAIVCVCVNRP